MRLNRVLLLAASLIMLVFAMVFTISCSGDDGKDGKNAVCTITDKPDGSGATVSCSDGSVGNLGNGPKGDPGQDAPGAVANVCTLGQQVGNSFTITCGSVTSPVIGSGSGGGGVLEGCVVENEDVYNPYELRITCQGSSSFYTCAGMAFNKKTQVCTNNKTRTDDANKNLYYPAGSVGGVTYGAAAPRGGQIIDLQNSSNVDVFKCDNAAYNPNLLFCTTTNELKELCGGASFGSASFCQTRQNGTKFAAPKCTGGTAVYPNTSFCNRNFATGDGLATGIATTTGTAPSASYDKILPYCGYDKDGEGIVYNESQKGIAANGAFYTGIGTFCQAEVKMTRCADATGDTLTVNQPVYFNAETEFCRKITATSTTFKVEKASLCVSAENSLIKKQYDGVNEFCDVADGKVKRQCGTGTNGVFYDATTHFCDVASGKPAVYCADAALRYNPDMRFCSFNEKGVSITQSYCTVGSEKRTYNVSSWKGEYCQQYNPGGGIAAQQTLLSCGIVQQPDNSNLPVTLGVCTPRYCVSTGISATNTQAIYDAYGITDFNTYPNESGLIQSNGSGGFVCKVAPTTCNFGEVVAASIGNGYTCQSLACTGDKAHVAGVDQQVGSFSCTTCLSTEEALGNGNYPLYYSSPSSCVTKAAANKIHSSIVLATDIDEPIISTTTSLSCIAAEEQANGVKYCSVVAFDKTLNSTLDGTSGKEYNICNSNNPQPPVDMPYPSATGTNMTTCLPADVCAAIGGKAGSAVTSGSNKTITCECEDNWAATNVKGAKYDLTEKRCKCAAGYHYNDSKICVVNP